MVNAARVVRCSARIARPARAPSIPMGSANGSAIAMQTAPSSATASNANAATRMASAPTPAVARSDLSHPRLKNQPDAAPIVNGVPRNTAAL